MVTKAQQPGSGDDDYYDELQEHWPTERPGRKRTRLQGRDRRVTVRATRRDKPSASHVSKALLAAQREAAKTQAEAEARTQAKRRDADV